MSRNTTSSGDPTLPPIHTVRGRRIVLDSDLAALYGVPTKVFNQTIRRNADRFPSDFAFQLTREKVANLKSQFVTSSSTPAATTFAGHGGVRKLPWAFTEHGAIMAATILRSPRAVEMSVYVVRAFIRMREEMLTNVTILKRLAHGARRRGEGVVRPRRTARDLVAGSRRSRPCRPPTEQIDKNLLEHDLVLRDVVEKLLPLLNAPPEPEPPRRRIGFTTPQD